MKQLMTGMTSSGFDLPAQNARLLATSSTNSFIHAGGQAE
jgi:hypothetical protein